MLQTLSQLSLARRMAVLQEHRHDLLTSTALPAFFSSYVTLEATLMANKRVEAAHFSEPSARKPV